MEKPILYELSSLHPIIKPEFPIVESVNKMSTISTNPDTAGLGWINSDGTITNTITYNNTNSWVFTRANENKEVWDHNKNVKVRPTACAHHTAPYRDGFSKGCSDGTCSYCLLCEHKSSIPSTLSTKNTTHLKYLLSIDKNPYLITADIFNKLLLDVKDYDFDTVKILIDTFVETSNIVLLEKLFLVAVRENAKKVIDYMFSLDLKFRDLVFKEALILAIHWGHKDLINLFMKFTPLIDCRYYDGDILSGRLFQRDDCCFTSWSHVYGTSVTKCRYYEKILNDIKKDSIALALSSPESSIHRAFTEHILSETRLLKCITSFI